MPGRDCLTRLTQGDGLGGAVAFVAFVTFPLCSATAPIGSG